MTEVAPSGRAASRFRGDAAERIAAKATLQAYIGKTLRITASDGRIFVGRMKCTDRECNIILALTHEYRPPSDEEIRAVALVSGASATASTGKMNMPFASRFVGLIVVPGKHVVKIEHEEWAGMGSG